MRCDYRDRFRVFPPRLLFVRPAVSMSDVRVCYGVGVPDELNDLLVILY